METGSLGRAYRSRAGSRGREIALSAPAADGYGAAETPTVRQLGGGGAAGSVSVGRMQRVVSDARTYQKAAAVCALKPFDVADGSKQGVCLVVMREARKGWWIDGREERDGRRVVVMVVEEWRKCGGGGGGCDGVEEV